MARKPGNGQNDTRLRGTRWWSEVGWKHVFAIVVIVFAVFPLLYVLSASVNPVGTLTGSTELFSAFTGEHYASLMASNFPRWMLNSFIVSTTTAIGTVLMAAGPPTRSAGSGSRGAAVASPRC
ncbi:hypothetical protein [Tessaracoccus coleopterorum]|uniref:hypothetical protein n=1 Tax=Tessaracoccus coleopterorum TaxID=2714950 RepID=UPI001E5DA09C|nr:hypothetical protein [Tessaracoccus coleopterorum]